MASVWCLVPFKVLVTWVTCVFLLLDLKFQLWPLRTQLRAMGHTWGSAL